jgi:copper ion binding protein
METITYIAPAISCEHCQHTIEGAIGSLRGVQAVRVDIPSKQVEVRYDPAQVSLAQIESTLDEEGYPARVLAP